MSASRVPSEGTTCDWLLARAVAYTNELDMERAARSEDGNADAALAADQGRALRLLVYYAGAAIVQAIRERPDQSAAIAQAIREQPARIVPEEKP